MWTLDVGIPARSFIEDAQKLRDEITTQFGPARHSCTIWGFVEFQIGFIDKVSALKAKHGVISFLHQHGFEVVDGQVSIGEAYVIAQPKEEL